MSTIAMPAPDAGVIGLKDRIVAALRRALPGLPVIAAILALALVSTAYGYILYFRILGRAGATNASLVTLLVPPSAVVLGFFFLGETLDVADFAGMALIALGLIVLDGRVVRALTKA